MVFAIINALLRRNGEPSGAEKLKEALAEPRRSVDLNGTYGEPRLDEQGANTAIIPVYLTDAETGEGYGQTALEFEIENAFGRSAFDGFLDAHDIDVGSLDEIEGREANVERDTYGNVTVSWSA